MGKGKMSTGGVFTLLKKNLVFKTNFLDYFSKNYILKVRGLE